MSNIITATFGDNERTVVTESQYMYATGQILQIEGLDLPSAYRVNFANSRDGQAKTQIGTDDGVIIPDVYFTTGRNIYAWIMLSTGDDDTEIEYDITIPILEAAEPEDSTATTEQVTIINQAINELSTALSELTAAETALERVEAAVNKMDTLTFEINTVGELVYTYDEEGGE